MEWCEVDSIPEQCKRCNEEDCYNCDIVQKRWTLSKEDKLRARRQLMVRAIQRLRRQITAIDMELLPFTAEQKAAMARESEMTYDLFWSCLQVCFDTGNMDAYMKIWADYPSHVATLWKIKNE